MVADVVSNQLLKLKFIDDFMKSLLNQVNFIYFSDRYKKICISDHICCA